MRLSSCARAYQAAHALARGAHADPAHHHEALELVHGLLSNLHTQSRPHAA